MYELTTKRLCQAIECEWDPDPWEIIAINDFKWVVVGECQALLCNTCAAQMEVDADPYP